MCVRCGQQTSVTVHRPIVYEYRYLKTSLICEHIVIDTIKRRIYRVFLPAMT